jgi:protease-4
MLNSSKAASFRSRRLTSTRAPLATLLCAGLLACVPSLASAQNADRAQVGLIEISGALGEVPGPLEWLFPSEDGATLRHVVDTIHTAAGDDDLRAIVIRVRDAALGTSQIEELGAAMRVARESGKRVVVFADQYSTGEILLGSYADEVLAQSGTGVMFPGLYMEEMFLADTFAWAGLKADMVQVGDYKGANEMMMRSAPSPQWDENINQLLDGMYASIRGPIKSGRNLTDEQLDAAMRNTWLADAEDAREAGLITHVIDLPDLTQHLESSLGTKITWTGNLIERESADMSAMASNPFAMLQMLSREPETDATSDTIAVLHINGTIVDGDSTEGGLFGGGSSVGSRTVRRALEQIAKDDEIKGLIVRIDSPGGSATASEVMWQGLERFARTTGKPVWASVGSMAASGGYYVAVGTDKIYMNQSSIVGSIGVVGGKISMSGLYDHLKVNVVGRGRGPMATLFATDSAWNAEQTTLVRTKMAETFDQFKDRVAKGREGIDLSKTAGGWLFTGEKALALNMADKIGGLDTAIQDMATELNLDEYEVMDFPGPRSLEEVIGEALKGFASAPGVAGGAAPAGAAPLAHLAAMGRELFGPRAWPAVENAMNGAALLRDEPVILYTPRVIWFR